MTPLLYGLALKRNITLRGLVFGRVSFGLPVVPVVRKVLPLQTDESIHVVFPSPNVKMSIVALPTIALVLDFGNNHPIIPMLKNPKCESSGIRVFEASDVPAPVETKLSRMYIPGLEINAGQVQLAPEVRWPCG